MVNEKLIAGAVMILLNLVVLAPIATSMVEDAVEDNFETYPYDSACADSDCTTAEEDWSTSTSEKTYYAWNLTNLDEVMSGDEPTYEKVGPFLYDITTTRNIIEFNESAGTLTYDESNSFSCSADTLNPCDTMITQLNIPFQPQVVGATGTAINGIMDLTKAGFAAGAIGNEMESFSAGQATADGIATSYGGIQAGAVTGSAVDAANASMMLGMGWYDAYDAFFAAMNLSGLGDTVTYTMAIQGLQAGEAAGVTFAGNASIGDLSYAFDSAVMPTGEDASLTSMQGVLILAGHCNAFATATYGEVMADAANGFANVGTMQRASIWGYASADINATIATDFAVCFGVGGTFSMTHGGADDDWFQDPLAVDASTRMMNYLGLDIDNTVAMNLLFGGQGTDMPTGILATNLESTSFGIAAFAGMDAATAMTTYSLDATQYAAVGAWVGGWLTSATALPMILLGGTGTMTAEEFVNVSFGAADPVNGGYLDNSINLGGAWGTALIPASEGAPSIDLAAAVSGNILYGPLGLTTATGATIFLFGELTGMTPPIDFTTMAPGAPMEWNAATIQALYGVDANAANALRTLMMSVIYGDFVPGFLVDSFGSSGQYMTMPLDNWLFGWRDPVSAFVAGDVTDPSLGWSKLETNETYFGSGGISTGPASIYVECTGHNSDCDKGEAISEDGSNQLSWRNDMMFAATFGLVSPVNLNETTGGFLTGSGDMVNAGGYGVTAVVCDGTGEVKGIPVDECTASIDPTTNPITAKLIKSFTLLDATTPALPVYFGTDISMMSEDISGLIISGSSTSTFYLDTRTGLDLATAPNMTDLQPVFEIQLSSEIEDDDAEDMESAIVQNQEYMGWWMNFDNGFDYVALLLYIGGVALIIMHFVMAGKDEEKDYS
ncbi:CD36 family protein [Candidatus Poseidoniaceae archaeon]|nr:CD36 family protein [Candidatus Poseidoniaceae archaeon]